MTLKRDLNQRASSEVGSAAVMNDETHKIFDEFGRAHMGKRLRFEEPLSRHSSLRIGGPAAIWAEVQDLEELVEIWELAKSLGLDVHLVGLGSNTLFCDEGLAGVTIRLVGRFAEWEVDTRLTQGAVIRVGAGMINAHLVRGLLAEGWVDAEFLALIPGTFGGAVAMNAGTRDTELGSIFIDADVLIPGREDGRCEVKTLTAEELSMSYRHAELPEEAIVIAGRIELRSGDVEAAREKVRLDKERRNETQPYRLASVGSTFANPEGDYAGRLIEAVGMKGMAIGGARISPLHANFFINEGDALARDFLELMATARYKVRHHFGIDLRPEVRFVGFDGYKRT